MMIIISNIQLIEFCTFYSRCSLNEQAHIDALLKADKLNHFDKRVLKRLSSKAEQFFDELEQALSLELRKLH